MIYPIRTEWVSYRHEVLPTNAPDTQIRETRRAFYAGAASLVNTLLNNLSDEDEATEEDMQFMDSVQLEITEFMEVVGSSGEETWDSGVS